MGILRAKANGALEWLVTDSQQGTIVIWAIMAGLTAAFSINEAYLSSRNGAASLSSVIQSANKTFVHFPDW